MTVPFGNNLELIFCSNNCEHFAHYCKRGGRRSRQVERGVSYAVAAGVTAVAVAVALALKSKHQDLQMISKRSRFPVQRSDRLGSPKGFLTNMFMRAMLYTELHSFN